MLNGSLIMRSIFHIPLLGALLIALSLFDARGADSKAHAIKIYTWQGLGTGFDSDVNQDKLKKNSHDSSDVDWYQSSAGIDKIKNSDVIYIANHGGKITSHPLPLIFNWDQDYPLEKLGFTRSPHKGPSVILNWGCQNGRRLT